ncbi:MAG: hypothetical protein LBM77_05510 [Spirochaetaceae bacterium]|jgi:hypothetical protein|nr:hypothetical protein [Spirochaetaceae bacterium]
MTQGRLMTFEEKLAIDARYIELDEAGRHEEAMEVAKTRPLSPALAMVLKQRLGKAWVLNSGWNLAEAEAKFGQGWLDT